MTSSGNRPARKRGRPPNVAWSTPDHPTSESSSPKPSPRDLPDRPTTEALQSTDAYKQIVAKAENYRHKRAVEIARMNNGCGVGVSGIISSAAFTLAASRYALTLAGQTEDVGDRMKFLGKAIDWAKQAKDMELTAFDLSEKEGKGRLKLETERDQPAWLANASVGQSPPNAASAPAYPVGEEGGGGVPRADEGHAVGDDEPAREASAARALVGDARREGDLDSVPLDGLFGSEEDARLRDRPTSETDEREGASG